LQILIFLLVTVVVAEIRGFKFFIGWLTCVGWPG